MIFGVFTLLAVRHGSAQSRLDVNIVRVTITPGAIYVSQSQVKPGKIRFLVNNRTTVAPDLEIIAEGGQSGKSASKLTPDVRAKRSWQEANLPPGTYQLRLATVPGNFIRITVAP